MSQKYFCKDRYSYVYLGKNLVSSVSFFFFFFFKKFKIILWNASCQEKINPVVSNISCFSVCKPGTHRLFILYNLEKRHGLFSLGLGSHSLGLILKLPPLTLEYLVRWSFRRTRCYYGIAMQPTVTPKFFFLCMIESQFAIILKSFCSVIL